MIRKIRKLIFHPNRYFYDLFRKKLGFRKYFVTDKIKLLDTTNHQKWHKVLFSHPYLYLYYKFNKRLRKPAYPILVDYRIENLGKNAMGGGKRLVLVIELENQNIFYFTDHRIVQAAIQDKEPDLSDIIVKFNFKGSGNKVYIESETRFGHEIKIDFLGNKNQLNIGRRVIFQSGAKINFKGEFNEMSIGHDCKFEPKCDLCFTGDHNCLHAKDYVTFHPTCKLFFFKDNSLAYFCSRVSIRASVKLYMDDVILIGERSSIEVTHICWWVSERKNILIGSDCMFSWETLCRTNDGHVLYDMDTSKRINNARSIIIGDHVWLGFNTFVLKGGHIGDNCMIGTKSIVTSKIPENSLCAGIPASVIKSKITWTRPVCIGFDESKIMEHEKYKKPDYEYHKIGYHKLLRIDAIDPSISSKEKAKLINQIIND